MSFVINPLYRATFKLILCFRFVVFWPDRHAAPAGEHLWIREGRGERGAELYELPDGPASFHHGDLRSSAAALWHPSYHFCAIHHHRSHHVFPICAQSQEKTPPKHIRERARPTLPGLRCWSALIPLCTCEMNVCPPLSLSNHIATVHSSLAIHFSKTQPVSEFSFCQQGHVPE